MSLDVYLGHPACPTCGRSGEEWSANITHNLGPMASEAGIYKCLWRPDENGIRFAHELIEPLKAGLAQMKAEPARFKKFDAKNGWGTYEQFVPWVEAYLAACIAYPEATVNVSR